MAVHEEMTANVIEVGAWESHVGSFADFVILVEGGKTV
jgi:hypothetical protein